MLHNCKISDIGEVVGGATPSTKKKDNYDGDIHWITPKDLSNYTKRYIFSGSRNISKKGYDSCSTKMVPEGTVLVTSRAPIGYIAIAGSPLCTNQGFKSIVPDNGVVDSEYLYYYLKNHINSLIELGTGTTFPEISGKILSNFKIQLPDLKKQKEIVSVIRPIDQLIEHTNQINDYLFDIQNLILDKFIQSFDHHFECLQNVTEVIDCLHSKKPELLEYGQVFLQLDNITDNGILEKSNLHYISEEDYSKWIKRCEVSYPDCVITNVGRSGAVTQIPHGINAAIGRNMTCLRLKNDFIKYPSFFISSLTSEYFKLEVNNNLDTGTILDSLNVKNIPKLRIICFESKIMDKLESILNPIRLLMEENAASIQTLTKIRDTLINKLIK